MRRNIVGDLSMCKTELFVSILRLRATGTALALPEIISDYVTNDRNESGEDENINSIDEEEK